MWDLCLIAHHWEIAFRLLPSPCCYSMKEVFSSPTTTLNAIQSELVPSQLRAVMHFRAPETGHSAYAKELEDLTLDRPNWHHWSGHADTSYSFLFQWYRASWLRTCHHTIMIFHLSSKEVHRPLELICLKTCSQPSFPTFSLKAKLINGTAIKRIK